MSVKRAFADPVRRNAKAERWRLKDTAQRILRGDDRFKNVVKCCQRLNGSQAVICMGEGGAYVAGVATCGSVWACPVCAAKISEGRRQEVRAALEGHVKGGGAVFMALFTLPHHAEESCAALKGLVADGWKRLIQGKAWQTAKKRWGLAYIRALEITYGDNGWHPHIHTLFFTRALDEFQAEELRLFLADRWADAIAKLSKTRAKDGRAKIVNLEVGFGFQRAASISAAGDYVAKWGTDSEIAKASVKKSRKGGRSPWQLLEDAAQGDHRARMAFKEYASAMKGARHLTWSRGLRDIYVQEPELTDEQLASLDAPFRGDTVIGVIRRFHWFEVTKRGLVPALLAAAEDAGWDGVLKFLRAEGLAFPEAVKDERPPSD